MCPKTPETTQFSLFRGVGRWAWCVYSSKAIALDRNRFWKLLGETEPEFVGNLKGLVDFEVRARIRKKAHRGRGSDPGLD
jgi:hypothetical protein